MTVSDPAAAWASCGLYSCPSSAGWISVIVANERGELVEQPVEQVVGDGGLHRRHRPAGLVGAAGAAQHVVDDGHGDVERVGEHALAGHRLEGERGDEDRVRQRHDVVVVGELLDPDQLQPRAGAEERGEDRGRLAGEGLLRDLQDPDVLTGELRRPAEVVGARLAAAAGRGAGVGGCGSGGPGGRGAAAARRLRRGDLGGGTGDSAGDWDVRLRGPVRSRAWSRSTSSAETGPTLTGGAGAPPVLREGCDGWCGGRAA